MGARDDFCLDSYERSGLTWWLVFGLLYVVGVPLYLNYQIGKMDRKLTCVYNTVQTLPLVMAPQTGSTNAVTEALKVEALKYVESSCDQKYIFTGIPK
jgi:hypothetical protein